MTLALAFLLLSCAVPVARIGDPEVAALDAECWPICDALPWGDAELVDWRFEEGQGDPSLAWCVCTLDNGTEIPVAVNVK